LTQKKTSRPTTTSIDRIFRIPLNLGLKRSYAEIIVQYHVSTMNNGIEPISNIINDNEERFNKTSLNIDIDEDDVERIADRLVEKLGYAESRPYYCKVARLLPETTLERLADTAKEVGYHSGRLFTYLTKKEIARLYNKSEGDSK